jgi:hypothetical protein
MIINIEIQNYNRRHINVIVSMGRDGVKWKFSGIYGNPETRQKERKLRPSCVIYRPLQPRPWICMGDFNEILNQSEKWGANTLANGQMEAFRRTSRGLPIV